MSSKIATRHKSIPGHKYIPKSLVPKKAPSLNEVRKRMAKIKGSFAATIAEIREED